MGENRTGGPVATLATLATRARPLALFAFAFALVAASLSITLRAAAPAPDLEVIGPKLAEWEARAGEFDTVFIGTSRTLYHVEPGALETAAAQAGCPGWNAFNFGVFGLTGSEQAWLIDQVLAKAGAGLERVVVEVALPERSQPARTTTIRGRFFHGPDRFAPAMGHIFSYPESLAKRVARAAIFAFGAGYDLSGVGRASQAVFPSTNPRDPYTFDFAADGFEPLGKYLNTEIVQRREAFLADEGAFGAFLTLYDAGRRPNLDAKARLEIARLRALEAKGFDAAFFVSPDLRSLDVTPQVGAAVAQAAPDLTVLNFNRPDTHADLFERDLWFDFTHLGGEGARLLSAKLGEAMCAARGAEQAGVHAVR